MSKSLQLQSSVKIRMAKCLLGCSFLESFFLESNQLPAAKKKDSKIEHPYQRDVRHFLFCQGFSIIAPTAIFLSPFKYFKRRLGRFKKLALGCVM
jgi:hypothetical protein